MAIITATDLHKTYATQQILDGAGFEINEGEKIGLIGANGTGKTTIFRILIGQEEPETGSVSMVRNLRFGYLAQIQKFNDSLTLRQEVESAFAEVRELEAQMEELGHRMGAPEPGDDMDEMLKRFGKLQEQHDAAGGYDYAYQVDSVMLGLGFSKEDFDKPVSVLSGGQKSRAALARLLLKPCDVLLLDEPTNHLDIEATTWLENYLREFKGAVLVISHDRALLDRVTDKTLELERRRIVSWPGNYSTYVELKQAKLEADMKLYGKQQAFIAKTEEFIRRFQAGQRYKQARGRKTRLERAQDAGEFLEEPGAEKRKTVRLKLESVERSGQDIVICKDLAMAYNDKKPLFQHLDFRIDRGERIGIVGPNGIGKSTLLKLIIGREKPIAGEVKLGKNVTLGYYDQQHADLDRSNTVINELWKIRPKETEGSVRSMLGRFLFSGDDVTKQVAKLSGGEQSRVVLAKLIWAGHNFLVLDEPTNHLDIPSCEVLEAALDGYDGTLLIVSHDRYFLDRIVDRIIAINPNGHEDFSGGWTDYAEKVAAREAAARAAKEAKKAEEDARAKKQREKELAAQAAAKKKGGNKATIGTDRFARLTVADLEARIMKQEERIADINVQFGDPSIYNQPGRVAELKAEFEAAQAELGDLNAAWEKKASEE